jgi:ribosomal-protein-alanine N-acetyltransferase
MAEEARDIRASAVLAGPFDIDLLARLQALCFDQPWGRDFVARMFAVSGGFSVLLKVNARTGRVPVGFAMCQLVAGEAELLTLGVLPDYCRRGLGRYLLRSCMDKAVARGANVMYLEVSEKNQAAQRLYAAAGFSVIGRRVKYYKEIDGSQTDALNMRCTLVG